jgi:hypothetical protein
MYGNDIADSEQNYKQVVVLYYNRCRRPNDKRVLLNNSRHTLYEVGSISKIEPYIQILSTVFLILLACELYICNSADGRNNSVLSQNFITIDNTKSSEPMKEKVKSLTPGKICEQTVDTNSDSTGNATMTADTEKGHEEVGTEPLLQEEWASSQSCYTECSGA